MADGSDMAWLAELLPFALLLCDRTGTVLLRNDRASCLLARHGVLRISAGRIEGYDTVSSHQLHRAWHRALGEHDTGSPRVEILRLERRASPGPLQLVLVPLQRADGSRTEASVPAVAVQLFDEAAPLPFATQRLRELYGLTRAEAEIAVAIAQGRDPGEIARDTNRSTGTVRGLLKRAMAKAGVNRQNALAALLWRGAAGPCADHALRTAALVADAPARPVRAAHCGYGRVPLTSGA